MSPNQSSHSKSTSSLFLINWLHYVFFGILFVLGGEISEINNVQDNKHTASTWKTSHTHLWGEM